MSRVPVILTALAATLALPACAAGSFTGPIEVTRFAAPDTAALGKGTIAVRFARELQNEAALDAFRAAVSDELALQGYTVIGNEEAADQIATVDTSRNSLAGEQSGSPVNVGVGGGTGTFGSGVGVGVGVNLGSLGGGNSSPRVMSELSVSIASQAVGANTQNLWEGRAQFPTSVNSPYAPVAINAQMLAAALFKDFPRGNGQTVSLEASELITPQ